MPPPVEQEVRLRVIRRSLGCLQVCLPGKCRLHEVAQS